MTTPSSAPKFLSESGRYRADIDGLRAIAVLAVVFYHLGLGVRGGFIGVDVFFVISGYLITSHIVRDLSAGTFSLVGFYERRCRRIVPASAGATLATLAAGAWVLLPLDLEWLGRSAVAHAACIANIYFYRQSTDYFAADAGALPLLHMWSLAVEEQFYFVLPLLLIALRRALGQQFSRVLPWLLLAIAVLSFAVSVSQVRTQSSAAFFLLPARAWELLLGSLLATASLPRLSAMVREAVGVAGLLAILAATLCFNDTTPFPGTAALLPCFGAAAVIWANDHRPQANSKERSLTAVGRLLSFRPVVFIGLISYSLYLWHWPLFVLTKSWLVMPMSVPAKLSLLIVMFSFAVASWRWIELPVRRRQIAGSGKRIFALTVASLSAVALVGELYGWKVGFPGRVPAAVLEFENERRDRSLFAKFRDTNPQEDRLPSIGPTAANDKTQLLLWGDSHAAAAAPAVEAFCMAKGIPARVAARGSMPPLLDFEIDPSRSPGLPAVEYNRAVLAYVQRQRIKNVILASYWQQHFEKDEHAFAVAMTHTVSALNELGVHVFVLMQVPAHSQDVPATLAKEIWRGQPFVGWWQTVAEHKSSQAVMYRLAEQLSGPQVTFIDPAQAFRPPGSEEFIVVDRGRSLYHDNNHASRWGARRVLGPLFNQALSDLGRSELPPATRPGL